MDENFVIPSDVLNDLCSRFIINVPGEERKDLIRIFFQIELAHWFYIDFHCTENASLKPCSIKNFAENVFRHCSFLIEHSHQVDAILSKWKIFKHAVPTNGAIILDESMRYVLLVQGFWAKASWGFPKGKVVEEESEMKCAIREVLEETGFDITNLIKSDQYLQISINEQTIRLYIITNVPRSTKFEPRTRREIKEVRWFAIDELPAHKKDTKSKQIIGYNPNAFFMVFPFVKGLKQWMHAYQSQNLVKTQQQQQQIKPNEQTAMTPSNSYPTSLMAKKSPSNPQLSRDEQRKMKQIQHFNKQIKDEYEDLVNNSKDKKFQKSTTTPNNQSSALTGCSQNINPHLNSRFKPVKQVKQQQQQQQVHQVQASNTPGLLNIISTTTTTTPPNMIRSKSNLSKSADHSLRTNNIQPQQHHQSFNNNRIRKQLDFYGPECWINFKFDHEKLFNDLPSIVA